MHMFPALRPMIAAADTTADTTTTAGDPPDECECDAAAPCQIAKCTTDGSCVYVADPALDGETCDAIVGCVDGGKDDCEDGDVCNGVGFCNMSTAPDGKSLDDIDGVSVWCVAVGVSFGDGLFSPP